ncbi:MAG: OmpA family protein [Chitinophagaceae bacterium]
MRLNSLLFTLLFLNPVFLRAQYHPDQVSKKARYYYEKAQQEVDQGSMDYTVGLLHQALDEDSQFLDAYAMLGSIYLAHKKYELAIPNFQRAYQMDTLFSQPLLFDYSKALAGMGRFQEAIIKITAFLRSPGLDSEDLRTGNFWLRHYLFAQQHLIKNWSFAPQNMGDSINTPDLEYGASETIDQKTLVFTRNIHSTNEDFFISHLDSNHLWSKAVNIGPPVNTPYNEGSGHISQDGRFLLYAGCNLPDGLGSCDIYYSVRSPSGWSPPQNIGPPINTRYWDTQPCLSSDNKDLYFVSNRPGGYGGSDIYVSHLLPDGHWGNPENLGPNINTPGDETTPFIHADNQTLYFASNGWPGIGNVDLFYSRKTPDGGWSRPVNLGYPINTIDHDGSLFVGSDGKTAIFASDRADSRGQLDLYSFILYPQARPIQTLFVKGYVYDARTQLPLPSELELINLETGKTMTHINTGNHGDYLVALPVGQDYAFHVSRPGYLFYSGNFSLKDKNPSKPYLVNIPLQPIEVNAHAILNNIFFDFDQYSLKPESKIELDKLVLLLKQNPTLKIQINGHTDNAGTQEHNLVLSRNRAKSVVQYLISKGIAADRLTSKGFGSTQPIADNKTEEGRAQNRRTEFVVIHQ